MAQEGSDDYFLVAIWIILWILDLGSKILCHSETVCNLRLNCVRQMAAHSRQRFVEV